MDPVTQCEGKKDEAWPVIPMSLVAERTLNPIRLLVDKGNLVPNPNLKQIRISIGDPTLDGEFLPPKHLVDYLQGVLTAYTHNGYAPAFGHTDARRAVSDYYTFTGHPLTENDVVLACGCSGALDMTIRALCNPGDSVLLPAPGFTLYQTICQSAGIECLMYKLLPERQWEIDMDDLEAKIRPNTKAILVNNPSNPCGSVYSPEHLQQIIHSAERHKLPIIADEIYADMCFSGTSFVSLAKVAHQQGGRVPILVCGGLAKRFVVPGWRLGWVVAFDHQTGMLKNIRDGMQQLSMLLLGPCTLIQGVVRSALFDTPDSYLHEMNKKLERSATLCFQLLHGVVGLKPSMPQGTMYMMVGLDIRKFKDIQNDIEFYGKLVEEQSVFILPLTAFSCPNYFRIVLSGSEETLQEACDRIRTFCREHAL